jgi:hypothetical protein
LYGTTVICPKKPRQWDLVVRANDLFLEISGFEKCETIIPFGKNGGFMDWGFI